jgi:hypothetical protein
MRLRIEPAGLMIAPERPESALCSRWLTTQRMGEDAPFQPLPDRETNR